MNVHHSQVGSVIQRSVQTLLTRGLNDPRVRGLVSVTKVELTDDFQQATIYISVMPAEHAELSLHGLRHAATHIRSQVGRDVRLRRLPRFVFRLDQTIKKQSEVLAAIAAACPPDPDAEAPEEPPSDLPRAEVSES